MPESTMKHAGVKAALQDLGRELYDLWGNWPECYKPEPKLLEMIALSYMAAETYEMMPADLVVMMVDGARDEVRRARG